ncbi:MAG: ABC transporter ATP-binding protein [Bacilli bacterium]
MSSEVALEIRNLTKVIGRKTIVDDLSFAVRKGEVFGLLGPNGAGKTTTIRMIVGLIGITKGSALVHGVDVTKDFESAMSHVGAIVENPEMYKYLSGYQNLLHFARMTPGVNRARIDEVVQLVGLKSRIHDRVRKYSLGMRQRLGLALALLRDPSILILDEPTNGLDPAGIREFRDHLRSLASQRGMSVIVSSHLLAEMELMCDRVAIIQDGKLVDIRSINEMKGDAASAAQTTRFKVDNHELAMSIFAKADLACQTAPEGGELDVVLDPLAVADVVAALVHAGVKVSGVRTVTRTLEESFLEMTGEVRHA